MHSEELNERCKRLGLVGASAERARNIKHSEPRCWVGRITYDRADPNEDGLDYTPHFWPVFSKTRFYSAAEALAWAEGFIHALEWERERAGHIDVRG